MQDVPLALIDSPPDNPRQDFDEAGLRSLADSIAAVGLLEPVIVRPKGKRFELVAGERRLRAVTLLGWKSIPAAVRELSDRQAAEVRLLENLDRQSLNPLEEAAAIRQLGGLGHTPESLAALLRWTEADVQGRMNLLDLPAEWAERIRRGELSPVAGELLTAWVKHPQVLRAMERHAEQWPMPLTEWRRRLADAVMALSRSMDPSDPTGPKFRAGREDVQRLDVVPVEVTPRTTLRRAMNVAVWDALQDAAEENERQAAAAESNGSAGHKARGNGAAPGCRPPRQVDPAAAARERIAQWAADWLQSAIAEHLAGLDVPQLHQAAAALGLDVAGRWRLSREFLELYDGERLRALADELGVDVTAARDDAEIAAVLLFAAPPQLPRDVLDPLRAASEAV